MKKVLLASTALVLSAGYAAADVSVKGSGVMGLQYVDGGFGGDDFGMHYELDFDVVATGSTDNGLTFGANFDLDFTDPGFGAENSPDDPEIWVEGAFGRITFGSNDVAADTVTLGIGDPGFDGIGVDDSGEKLGANSTFTSGSANVLYQISVGDLDVAVSGNLADSGGAASDDYSIALAYSFGDYNVAVGYTDASSQAVTSLGFQGNVSGFGFDLFYQNNDDADASGYGVYLDYGLANGVKVNFAYADNDLAGSDAGYGVGFSYGLGGGLTLAGAIGSVSDTTVADLGLQMKF